MFSMANSLIRAYRVHAAQCTLLASRITDPDGKRSLLNMAQAWLALAVTTGTLPKTADVLRFVRDAALDGPRAALYRAIATSAPP